MFWGAMHRHHIYSDKYRFRKRIWRCVILDIVLMASGFDVVSLVIVGG